VVERGERWMMSGGERREVVESGKSGERGVSTAPYLDHSSSFNVMFVAVFITRATLCDSRYQSLFR
jgi:hypothetical protein